MDYILQTLDAESAFNYLRSPLSSKDDEWENTCNEAELPLSIAAWNADGDMIKLLMGKDIDLAGYQNSKGQTAFHTLVEVGWQVVVPTN